MWRQLSVAALAVVLCGLSGCADRQKAATADARIMFSGETDFRRVAMHSTREVRVNLQNVGRSRLNILDIAVEDQDGAYIAKFDHEGPHDVIPGGSCDAVIRFTPRRKGSFPAKFVIHTDSVQEPVLRVELKGEGVDARAIVQENRLDFGRIEVQSQKLKTVTLENPSDLPVKVTPRIVGAHGGEFSVQEFELAPFESRSVDVLFAPTSVGVKNASMAVRPCEGCVDHVITFKAEGLDRAIIAEPPQLDFGQVPMDRDVTLPVTLRNISTEPQEVTGLVLAESTDPSFTHVGGSAPVVLNGGDAREFQFRYSPGHMGMASGEAVYSIGSVRNPELRVQMAGFGGAPELCVSPVEHRFTPKPVGARVSKGIVVKNCGSSNSQGITITELVVQPSLSGVGGHGFFAVSEETLPVTLQAGEEMTFRIYYEPTSAGEHAARVGIRTNGLQVSSAQVDISGSAFDHQPCRLAITPGVVDFGTVPPGYEQVLGIKIENIGTDVCPVKNIELVDDSGGTFFMPGGDIPGVIVYAGYYFSFMVGFDAPNGGGAFSGSLKIEVSDPANPVVYVPLVANSQESCIVATPPYLDFGISRPGCSIAPQATTLMNQCSMPVQVNSVSIGAGTTDGEFAITSQPSPLPQTLQPGDTASVEVDYLATLTGMNLSPLYVGVDGLSRPLLVPLIGEASKHGEKTDVFVQQDGSKVDVLFVVDNTASMVEEHPRLVNAIPSFISAAQQKNVDLRVAVTTTGLDSVSGACPGGANGGEAGRFFPVDNARPRVLTLSTSNVVSVLQQNVQVGQCALIEKGFEALRRALSPPLVNNADDSRTAMPNDGNEGFLRDEAALAVIFVGDEDDHSEDSVDTYVDWLRGLKGRSQPQRSVIHAIAPTAQSCSTAGGTGTRYQEAATRTGGTVLSICASDYAPVLTQMAGQAFSPQDTFALSSEPESGSIRVFIDGTEQFSGWTYEAATNQVRFSAMPPAGARIEVRYTRSCAP